MSNTRSRRSHSVAVWPQPCVIDSAMKVAAGLFLVWLSLQAAYAGPILKTAVKAGVKLAAADSAKSGGGSAAALPGLPGNIFSKLEAPANFSVGSCTGYGFCFPHYIAATFGDPKDICADGSSLNVTGLGQTVCVQRSYRPVPSCFFSTQCPSSSPKEQYEQSEELCMSQHVRGTLVGMLTVFKVHATLPFKILPALKTALVQAVTFPVRVVDSITLDVPELSLENVKKFNVMPKLTVNLTLPEWDLPDRLAAMKLGHLMKQTAMLASAGTEVAEALSRGQDPMGIVAKCLLNVNMTEFIDVMPQIDAWVSEKLQGTTNVDQVTADISKNFPDCLYRCCKQGVVIDTALSLATKSCSSGLELNSVINKCVSLSGYNPCPQGMTRCELPIGQPVCVVDHNMFGLDSCKVALMLSPALPRVQCPEYGSSLHT